jgi:hypothetical protein
MYVCLNSLMAFSLLGITELTQPMFKRFQARYRGVLSFFAALIILFALIVGLLLGAFHE